MSIEATVTETIAKVELGDDYRVELKQRKKRETYSPAEAIQLAGELIDAAKEALEVFRIDQPRAPFQHGFDVDLDEREARWAEYDARLLEAVRSFGQGERTIDLDEATS